MKEVALSRSTTVNDTRAAAALGDPMLRRIVLCFVGAERSIGEVAAEHGLDLKRLHHHVKRLSSVGLLTLVGERRRAGRPIKLYRAAADSFFIPFEVAPELLTDKLSRELRARIRAEHLRSGDGMLLSMDENGLASLRLIADEGSRAAAFEAWSILLLDAAEAEALRRDLKDVIERHAEQASGRGKPYLVHAAVARRLAPTVSVDNLKRPGAALT